jgi:S-formylglutathione hydrolase FrmB
VRLSLVLLALVSSPFAQQLPVVQERSHPSQVLGGDRPYRILLPPNYAASQKRYPVLYWLYGYTNTGPDGTGPVGAYVVAHDIIVVTAGPIDTVGTYPLYFPELVDHIDKTYRTVADRGHRGTSGFGIGGYFALWIAGKYPDLVASASALSGYSEAPVGPQGLDVPLRDDALIGNYAGVRTMRNASSLESILQFHGSAFADPPARPAAFDHADVYPNFTVWGWEVAGERRQPAFTNLENVSSKGFRSAVREWLPGGATMPEVKLSIASAPRLYPPGSSQTITYLRLRDGKLRRTMQKADAQGRLNFELDGDDYEVGISAEPLLAVSGFEIVDAAWATAGKPVLLRVKFWNKGGARSPTAAIKWESSNSSVQFTNATSRIYGLAAGESAAVPISFTSPEAAGPVVKIVAVDGTNRMPFDVPLYPPAQPTTLFQIADGITVQAMQHGNQHAELTYGEGNRDNHAAPGESFAILFPEGEYLRAAELVTNDACVDNTVRGTDAWSEYVSVLYSLPSIRADCQPGHVVHMLAKVPVPNAPPQYWAIQFPVWYRN